MQNKNNKPVQKVVKPYLTGAVTDENTKMNVLKLFGVFVLIFAMTFIVCMMTGFASGIFHILINLAIELLVLFILYNSGSSKGAEAVARGEILYQRREKGREFTPAEQRLSFHPAKGFLCAVLALVPVLICAVVLAITAKRQITGFGVLPSWMDAYKARSEIGGALAAYTTTRPASLTDILRIIVRICIMPFVSMAGTEDSRTMLMIERLSPVLLLLPAIAYGAGYLSGRNVRTRIHTEISENRKKSAKKEKKIRMARRTESRPRGPEQLN